MHWVGSSPLALKVMKRDEETVYGTFPSIIEPQFYCKYDTQTVPDSFSSLVYYPTANQKMRFWDLGYLEDPWPQILTNSTNTGDILM